MHRIKSLFFLSALILSTSSVVLAQSNADDCIGVWKTGNGKAHVQIFKNGDKYFGRIIWLREPTDPETNKPKLDKNNNNESKRSRPIMGLNLLRNFEWDADDKEWEDGKIYDPENGKDYSCTMKMKDANTLAVRGYVMTTAFGRTDTWKRQSK